MPGPASGWRDDGERSAPAGNRPRQPQAAAGDPADSGGGVAGAADPRAVRPDLADRARQARPAPGRPAPIAAGGRAPQSRYWAAHRHRRPWCPDLGHRGRSPARCASGRSRRCSDGKVHAAEPDALDEMVETYSSLAERSSFGFGTWPARQPLREALALHVDRVLLDFRQPEPTVREMQWQQARGWAAKALELGADDSLRARFLLCDAHVKRIDGDAAIYRGQADRATAC